MSFRIAGFRLDAWELAYLGFVVGVALMTWLDEEPEPGRPTEQTVSLREDALRRLEDGGTVEVPRWHGNALALEGSVVVDATESVSEDTDQR